MKHVISTIKDHLLSKYCIMFLMVLTSNIIWEGAYLLSDILYGLLALLVFVRINRKGFRNIWYYILIYFILATFVNYYTYSNVRGLQSCLRFLYNFFLCITFIVSFDKSSYRLKIINGYIDSCVFFSSIILLQFASFYLLKYNIDLSFGELAREANVANEYDPLADFLYRTGGLFKEPSHYAAFVGPSIFMCYRLRYTKQMFFIILGSVLSTSGLSFIILFVFTCLIMMKANRKIKLLFLSFIIILLVAMPFLIFHIQTGGSSGIRIIVPFTELFKPGNLGLLGGNPAFHYSGDEVLWINTFVFICLYFGIIGICIFLRFIYYSKYKYLTVVLIWIIVIEGIYGRIDFWMTILACYLFNRNIGYYSAHTVHAMK